jgi:hypothetical protein
MLQFLNSIKSNILFSHSIPMASYNNRNKQVIYFQEQFNMGHSNPFQDN